MSSLRWIVTTLLLFMGSEVSAQYRNYSLRCLAPLLDNIDPNAPETLQQAFLIGPTKNAALRDGVGREAIQFPISTDSAEVAEMFKQGIALLHTLSYKEAEQAFRTVVALDPDCPMGYWGLAHANERFPDRARIYATAAAERCDRNRPELEQRWTALLAAFYADSDETDLTARSLVRVKELEELSLDFPGHSEVSAFLIRRLTLDPFLTGLPLTSRLGVGTLAKEFAATHPLHPSLHYGVFLWLERRPQDVLEAAARMTKLTPEAAEIWRYASTAHLKAGRSKMASHFGEIALLTDHKTISQQDLMPWEAENLFENYSALVEDLTFAGRIEEALEFSKAAILLPRELSLTDERLPPGYLWANALMLSENWEQLIHDLESSPYLRASDSIRAQAARVEWSGLAHLAQGNFEKAQNLGEALIALERESLIKGVPTATEKAIATSRKTFETVSMLLTSEAKEDEIRSLKDASLPPLVKSYFYELAGMEGAALLAVEDQNEKHSYRWLNTAVYSRLAMKTGRDRDALFVIDRRFRSDASLADKDLPALESLAPIIEKLRLPSPWTLPDETPVLSEASGTSDAAAWLPLSAPEFTLPDRLEKSWSLSDFSDSPVLIQFFLGTQCAFCLQQFETFQPHWPAFDEAGIQLLAISINSLEELKTTLGENKELDPAFKEKFPFPILADPELKSFKDFGVFDDFESGPMHATVLVSPKGRILWRNISHEPFAKPEALLNEATRLLKVHALER